MILGVSPVSVSVYMCELLCAVCWEEGGKIKRCVEVKTSKKADFSQKCEPTDFVAR